MHILVDRKLQKEFLIIGKKNPKLAKQIQKQLELFKKNPKHKSLRIHKLSGELKNLWSISINKSLRMTYILDKDIAYLIDLGTHDEVYKK